jgi:serine protease
VLPVRVLGHCGGYTSDIADGLAWASGATASGVPTNPNPARVANLSLGGGRPCGTTMVAAQNAAR